MADHVQTYTRSTDPVPLQCDAKGHALLLCPACRKEHLGEVVLDQAGVARLRDAQQAERAAEEAAEALDRVFGRYQSQMYRPALTRLVLEAEAGGRAAGREEVREVVNERDRLAAGLYELLRKLFPGHGTAVPGKVGGDAGDANAVPPALAEIDRLKAADEQAREAEARGRLAGLREAAGIARDLIPEWVEPSMDPSSSSHWADLYQSEAGMAGEIARLVEARAAEVAKSFPNDTKGGGA